MTVHVSNLARVCNASAFSPAIARCVKRLFAALVGVFLQEGFSDSSTGRLHRRPFTAENISGQDRLLARFGDRPISPLPVFAVSRRLVLGKVSRPTKLRWPSGPWKRCCGCPPGDCVIHLLSGIAVLRPLVLGVVRKSNLRCVVFVSPRSMRPCACSTIRGRLGSV